MSMKEVPSDEPVREDSRQTPHSVEVSGRNRFSGESLQISRQEPLIAYWNEFLMQTGNGQNRLEVRTIPGGTEMGPACTMTVLSESEQTIELRDDSEPNSLFHKRSAVLSGVPNSVFRFHFSSTAPHAIHLTHGGNSVIKFPQNYFGKKSHWLGFSF